jgi:hypothetical protein
MDGELDLEKIFNLIRNPGEWKRLVGEYAYLRRNIARLENALRDSLFYTADKNEDYINALWRQLHCMREYQASIEDRAILCNIDIIGELRKLTGESSDGQ